MKNLLTAASLLVASFSAQAGLVQVSESDFIAGSDLITFSEYSLGTVNPVYNDADYGTVTFGGWFEGQSLSANPAADCPGAAASACIVGNPTGPLAIDANSTDTFITRDGANPTSPVLSGSPRFNGGIAVLFSEDQYGVGFDGGYFNAIASTAITAFDRDGNILGSVANSVIGIEFLGLVIDGVAPVIAGVFLDLVGSEPAGFAIDNLRFAQKGEVVVSNVPVPAAAFLFAPALLGFVGLRRKAKQA
jgi:hypothetical protein